MAFRYFTFSLLFLILTGCSHYNYSPNSVPTPLITKKNESSLSADFGGIIIPGHLNAQAAYNPWNKVTLLANYYGSFNQSDLFYPNQTHRVHYLEGGAGIWDGFYDERFHAGFLAGGGAGRVKNDFGRSRMVTLTFNKVFVQPTLTFNGHKFWVGMGGRFSFLKYTRGGIDFAVPDKDLMALMLIEEHSPFLLLEGGVNFGLKFRSMTFSVYLVRGGMSSKPEKYQFDLTKTSVGLSVDLSRFYKNRQEKGTGKQHDLPDTNLPE